FDFALLAAFEGLENYRRCAATRKDANTWVLRCVDKIAAPLRGAMDSVASFSPAVPPGRWLARSTNSDGSSFALKRNRRQKYAREFVIEADGHEGHGLDYAEAVREAPPEELGVARGEQDAGASKGVDRCQQGLEIGVRFSCSVTEEGEARGVAG